jgi:hypothetical protein
MVSERGSMVNPRMGSMADVGPLMAYTKSPKAATSKTRPRSGS